MNEDRKTGCCGVTNSGYNPFVVRLFLTPSFPPSSPLREPTQTGFLKLLSYLEACASVPTHESDLFLEKKVIPRPYMLVECIPSSSMNTNRNRVIHRHHQIQHRKGANLTELVISVDAAKPDAMEPQLQARNVRIANEINVHALICEFSGFPCISVFQILTEGAFCREASRPRGPPKALVFRCFSTEYMLSPGSRLL